MITHLNVNISFLDFNDLFFFFDATEVPVFLHTDMFDTLRFGTLVTRSMGYNELKTRKNTGESRSVFLPL